MTRFEPIDPFLCKVLKAMAKGKKTDRHDSHDEDF